MRELKNWLVEEESGQGMVEYALIIVLIALALVAGLGKVKGALDGVYTKIEENLQVK